MIISLIWPDILLFLVSGIRPDIRQVKSGIWLDAGYKKRPDSRCIPNFTDKSMFDISKATYQYILNTSGEETGTLLLQSPENIYLLKMVAP
jgi:hypothetical protein